MKCRGRKHRFCPGRASDPEAILEFKSQRKLPNAVPAGVTGASFLNLSERTYGGISSTLTQIVARIIEVGVVGEIGKAALELQLKPFRELEVLGQPRERLIVPGPTSDPTRSVAKAANNVGVGAIKRVLDKSCPACAAGAGEYVRIPPLVASVVKVVGIARKVRPVKAKIGRCRRNQNAGRECRRGRICTRKIVLSRQPPTIPFSTPLALPSRPRPSQWEVRPPWS